ncbi:hypothetical protein NDU88_008333 [Pleurodeles waltl]|uniref:Uncharacterized protein n=1 Tax=Pleurodeles waltl TaxID=8319 RepID=A0AAV7RTH7_PLEWA|nr:hypothetical protein NDU88_008333 [Pleurodeles waltl]
MPAQTPLPDLATPHATEPWSLLECNDPAGLTSLQPLNTRLRRNTCHLLASLRPREIAVPRCDSWIWTRPEVQGSSDLHQCCLSSAART